MFGANAPKGTRPVQIGDDFTDRNQLAALTLHGFLFSHVPQTRQGRAVHEGKGGGTPPLNVRQKPCGPLGHENPRTLSQRLHSEVSA